jgi:hypothetical protein
VFIKLARRREEGGHSKERKLAMFGNVAQMVECLPSMSGLLDMRRKKERKRG